MKSVFVSHSSRDLSTANSVVEALEREGISVWIAPRDIPAGSNYGASITKGIRECAILLLVFSRDSNVSPAVYREVQKAFEENKVIIPLRVEDVPISDDLSFYLSGLHWLDAIKRGSGYDELVRNVKHVLQSVGRLYHEAPPPHYMGMPVQHYAMPGGVNPAMAQSSSGGGAFGKVKKIAVTITSVLGVVLIIFVIWAIVTVDETPEPSPDLAATQTPTPAPHASPEPESTAAPEETPEPVPELEPEPYPQQFTWRHALETAIDYGNVRRDQIFQLGIDRFENHEIGVVWEVHFEEFSHHGTVYRWFVIDVDTGEVLENEYDLWRGVFTDPPQSGFISWEQALEIALAQTDTTRKEITQLWIEPWAYSDEVHHPGWDAWGVDIGGVYFGQRVWDGFDIYAATGEIMNIE